LPSWRTVTLSGSLPTGTLRGQRPDAELRIGLYQVYQPLPCSIDFSRLLCLLFLTRLLHVGCGLIPTKKSAGHLPAVSITIKQTGTERVFSRFDFKLPEERLPRISTGQIGALASALVSNQPNAFSKPRNFLPPMLTQTE
jgi:hypothetical protein